LNLGQTKAVLVQAHTGYQ